MSFSLCLDYILFFDFVAVIFIVASLDEAIKNAKEVLANPNSSLEDIKNAADGVLEAIGNLEEKAPADSDVPTAIKCLYVKISEKSEIFI